MKLLDMFKRDELESFNGEVYYAVGDVVYYGYINDDDCFVELFAESYWGRSHIKCGTIHPVSLESLSVCNLRVEL